MFDLLDCACAENLRVDVPTYIRVIESTTEFRRNAIILTALDDDDPKKLEQARRCFKMIKENTTVNG